MASELTLPGDTCPAVAYRPELDTTFRCDLLPVHDGRHECRVDRSTTVWWSAVVEFRITRPTMNRGEL